MSTTVTYKGSTLTTAENQTKTLLTQGKYLEDNITITDVTSVGYVTQDQDGYIVLPPTGGGSTWNWMGKNPTLVKDYGTTKVYLKDTGYATWTPSTTATMIEDSVDLESYTTPLTDYDYVLIHKVHTHFEYGNGATGTAQIIDSAQFIATSIIGYWTNSSFVSNQVGTYYSTSPTCFLMRYYNSSGDLVIQPNLTYGVWRTNSGFFGGTYSVSTGLRIIPKSGQFYARCNDSYFSTTSAGAVNQNTSYYEYDIKLYRVDRGTTDLYTHNYEARDIIINGI